MPSQHSPNTTPQKNKQKNNVLHKLSRAVSIASSDRVSGLIMLAFAIVGFAIANFHGTFEGFEALKNTVLTIPFLDLHLSVDAWVQDGMLTIFFLAVGLELKQEITHGSLSDIKAAAVPIFAAMGGMAIPALLFTGTIMAWPFLSGSDTIMADGKAFSIGEVAQGWAVPTATDIAFSLTVLAIFARTLPTALRAFLLTLATVDDLLGIVIIAIFYSDLNDIWWVLGIVGAAAVWAWSVRRKEVPWLLAIVAFLALWYSMHELGIHPTLSGVIAGLLTPAGELFDEEESRVERYNNKISPYSSLLALPIFALFATGVHFDKLSFELFTSPVVLGIILALVIGKPLGILGSTWIATHLSSFTLADDLRVRDIVPISLACGIGFTVAFLIASLAYDQPQLSNEARFGVLIASLVSAILAALALTYQSRRFDSDKK
ncbi:Na+/H+ antiporter NhaA [Alloscardovia criceti]|uniref:Na+/H+ antiporter NhaA n=1 Tax=Alloscardovia criceti TaxID=356828 RepID=UPI0003657B80|nr:Na+/H+ antiporter NhaA [Alloscardovia criceti]